MSANGKGKAVLRQQSSENNSVSSNEWDMASDVFVTDFSDTRLGDGVTARDSALPGLYHGLVHGLDGHLPLMREDSHRLDDEIAQDVMMLGLSAEDYSSPSYLGHDLDIDPEFTGSDENVSTKKRLRSNSSRHRGEIVTELGPEEVRWFYKEDKRTWKPFVGHDSLKIELVYRRFCELNPDRVRPSVSTTEAEIQALQGDSVQGLCGGLEDSSLEAVCVRGGLYEVDIREKECYPVYWNREWIIKHAQL